MEIKDQVKTFVYLFIYYHFSINAIFFHQNSHQHQIVELVFICFLESLTTYECSVNDSENNSPPVDNTTRKGSCQRFKPQNATVVVSLVEFHDALSKSVTFSSDFKQRS